MKTVTLNGWNVGVEKAQIETAPIGDAPPQTAEGWTLRFTEVLQPTGDQIAFTFGREVRDMLVRELTGGIVLHGGELPRL